MKCYDLQMSYSGFRTYLAIDYGTKRVGIALATSPIAEPLTVLASGPELQTQILALIKQHQPQVVVVGRSEREMAQQSEAFSAELQAYLHNAVERGELAVMPEFDFADETLSSVEAVAKLHQAGKRDIRQHGPIDHFAAAQLLQNYLDEMV